MRAVIVAVILLFARPAAAEPWWYGFFGTAGYRAVIGVDNASRASFAGGYRWQRRHWAVEAGILELQYGLDEGVHTIGRLSFLARIDHRTWVGTGASYGWAKGWVDSVLPKRIGAGPQVDLAAGRDIAGWGALRGFIQLHLTIPLYRLYDIYRSTDSPRYAVAIELASGLRF